MAMAAKTSLKNKHLCKGDYFATIASSSHSIMFTNNASEGITIACSRCR